MSMQHDTKPADIFIGVVSIMLAFPVMLVIHIGRGFGAFGKKFWAEHKSWWRLAVGGF